MGQLLRGFCRACCPPALLAAIVASTGCSSSPTAASSTTTTTTTTASVPTIASVFPTVGLNEGGQTVAISGTNFQNVSAVKFGNQDAASYTVLSTVSITAVAPPSTGAPDSVTAVEVTVTTDVATTATSSGDVFTYTHNTLTNISFDPPSAPGGTTIIGTAWIAYPAPASGYTLVLSSSSTTGSTAASIPATVTISPGFTTGSFVIATRPVQTLQCFLVSANLFAAQQKPFCVSP
jgi:hypothetical protein